MRALGLPLLLSGLLVSLLATSSARADNDDDAPAPVAPAPPAPPAPPPPPPAPPAPEAWPLPPNVNVAPNGDITVTRTDAAGVDVHAQTPSGTVHAYSCAAVKVDASSAGSTSVLPCPPGYVVPPAYAYRYAYVPQPIYPTVKAKPKYAPDPTRRAALLASTLVFSLGTVAAGTSYIMSTRPQGCFSLEGCPAAEPSKPALYTMGGIMTLTPSLPRLVMGDVGMAVLATALRGGSFAAGAFIDWKDKTYVLPVTFAFVVPLTIGIIDLATTPHRENMEAREKDAAANANKVKLRGLGPTVAMDKKGEPVPSVSAVGTF